MIQYIKFVQNPSFGSRDMVQTSFFGKSLTFKVLVWPWKWDQSPKSNHFFLMSQLCFCASLVKIHQLVQEKKVQPRLIFTVFIVWWPWKSGSLARIHHLVQEIRCRLAFFCQNLKILVFIVWWPWKLSQGYQNTIKSLNHLNVTIYEVWPESVTSSFWLKIQVLVWPW